jgi:hypothetical protein
MYHNQISLRREFHHAGMWLSRYAEIYKLRLYKSTNNGLRLTVYPKTPYAEFTLSANKP